ncbi:MFS general substrate transporter [Desarmillaria tabescens]|uniref:MFS general substrate transporter n=1 Tax=Armillaria tabescens TaxID=1929756 RepID=A0AA39U342_ARMTA|nr:MFS general substrate transporter [Desarmillaria tabescens]KAK0466080.1 MFS general substrate transporter [Desarmillaria tabescens]
MSASDVKLSTEAKSNPRLMELSVNQVDTGAALVVGKTGQLSRSEATRIRRKIDRHIVPLMCLLYAIQYMDKATLGNAAVLGLLEDTHLNADQYNWFGIQFYDSFLPLSESLRLSTIFYLGYLVFEFPQNLCLQRLPVGKWLSFNILVWAIALCTHAACKNFAGLFVVRMILGMSEGCITTGFMIVTSMFYTRTEQTLRVGYWFLMDGTAQVISGFISFGTLHMKTNTLTAWQWLMIILGMLTMVTAIAFWFLFPDSPTNAWFLTPEERSSAVQRLKENQTGVENKHFKKEQYGILVFYPCPTSTQAPNPRMVEALTDIKTWLFALFSVLANIPNSLANQRQLIILSFGFSNLNTTLLGCVPGVVAVLAVWSGTTIAARVPNSQAWVGVAYLIPNLVAVFLMLFLSWDDKVGLLVTLFFAGLGVTAFVLSLSWLSSTTAGHTKRITVNTIMLSAYCIGNAVGPLMWREKYKPRNRVPWIIIGVCVVFRIMTLLAIRYLLSAENRRRDAEPVDTVYDDVYIEQLKEDGVMEKAHVDKEFLDLTDKQNRDFRYVL